MKYLWVFAHPEPRSFSGSLRNEGIARLRQLGHEVRQSDLYAMGWNPTLDARDFGHDSQQRLIVGDAQRDAQIAGTVSDDVRAEQDKLMWADALIIHFPLWWLTVPAILKGWFDRVFAKGFAFGLTDPETGRVRQYGDGGLVGKRAMVITSYGARQSSMGPRGIHGDINEILFPIQHGILWYTGIEVVPPFTVDRADGLMEPDFASVSQKLHGRLAGLYDDAPIPFRYKDRGDFGSGLVLRDELAADVSGLAVHYRD